MATESEPTNKEKQEKLKAVWTYTNKKILLEIAVEEVKKGNRPTTTFNHKGYESIISEFYKKTGIKYERGQFKNILQQLKNEYREWKVIKGRSGLGWDPDSNMIVATEEEWKDYIKMHPHAKAFKKGLLQFEEELSILFDGTTALGEDTICPAQDGGSSPNVGWDELNPTTPNIEVEDLTNDGVSGVSQKKRRIEKSLPKKDSFRGEIREAIASLVELSKLKLLRESTSTPVAPSPVPPPISTPPPPAPPINYSYAVVVKILDDMEEVDVESDFYLDVLDMFKDSDKRELFVAMNPAAFEVVKSNRCKQKVYLVWG